MNFASHRIAMVNSHSKGFVFLLYQMYDDKQSAASALLVSPLAWFRLYK